MRVELRFTFADGEGPSDTKRSFWDRYLRGVERAEDERHYSPDYLENQVYTRFGRIIERAVNAELSQEDTPPYDLRRRLFGPRSPQMRFRVIRVTYGSLDIILSVLGIDSDSVRDLVLDAIESYAPEALSATVGLGRAGPAVQASIIEAGGGAMNNDRTAIRTLMSGSLLIPVIMALLICYVAFDGLVHGMQALKDESGALRAERSDLLKALVDQNVRLSALLMDASKEAAANSKATEALYTQIMKARASALGLLPINVPTAPTAAPPTSP